MESVGILIALRPIGERDSVARIFTHDYGLLTGMLKGAQTNKKNKPLIGQLGEISWNARLDSQLGVFHWEAEKNLVAKSIWVKNSLEFINCAFELIDVLLPERECYENLYESTLILLEKLHSDDPIKAYTNWEVKLLQDLGYALDLTSCSGCGCKNNLKFLSPKTGRAVCETCAIPYIDRLYKLPLTLDVTGRFIQAICDGQCVKMPFSRKLLKKI